MSQYPFDHTGVAVTNRVPNELHTVGAIDGQNNWFFFLDAAPFFADSVAVVDVATGDTLIPYTDFSFGHEHQEATEKINTPVYSAVVLNDPNRTGSYKVTYQTIGSDFVDASVNAAITDGLKVLENLQNIPWESLVDVPTEFPPTPHTESLEDVEGWQQIRASLEAIRSQIESVPTSITLSDVTDLDDTLVTPLLTNLADIAANISALEGFGGIRNKSKHGIAGDATMSSPGQGTWIDTPIEITEDQNGAYLLTVSPKLGVDWTSVEGTVRYRWVKNDSVLALSYADVAPVSVSEPTTFKLQVFLSEAATTLYLGDTNAVTGMNLMKTS